MAGSLLDALVFPADTQRRDAAPGLIERCRDACMALARFFAEGGYAEPKLEAAIAHLGSLATKIHQALGYTTLRRPASPPDR